MNPSRTREAARRRTPTVVSALRGEGHDVAVVGESLEFGSPDSKILAFARENDRVILSEDTDFRGADTDLAGEHDPGLLACDTGAPPGEIAAAIRRIEALLDTLDDTVLYVPGDWI